MYILIGIREWYHRIMASIPWKGKRHISSNDLTSRNPLHGVLCIILLYIGCLVLLPYSMLLVKRLDLVNTSNRFWAYIRILYFRATLSLAIADGLWHHVCFTWENKNGTWELYLDGTRRENGTNWQTGATLPENGTLVIGQTQLMAGTEFLDGVSFRGQISHFKIFNRIVPPLDVAFVFPGSKRADAVVMWTEIHQWASTGGEEDCSVFIHIFR